MDHVSCFSEYLLIFFLLDCGEYELSLLGAGFAEFPYTAVDFILACSYVTRGQPYPLRVCLWPASMQSPEAKAGPTLFVSLL